jgi:hypothetical protein
VKENFKLIFRLSCSSVVSSNPIERELMNVPVDIGLEMYAEKAVVLPFFTDYVARGLVSGRVEFAG